MAALLADGRLVHLAGVVAGPDQGARLDVGEPEVLGVRLEVGELLGGDEPLQVQVGLGRLQVLGDGQ